MRNIAVLIVLVGGLLGQVHYYEDGRPWSQKAGGGPDKDVPGWFYNLGETGIRVALVEAEPTTLFVRHVLAGSVAEGKLKAGDRIVGTEQKLFETPHRNGYGKEVFGAAGPISDFATALDAALGGDRKLALRVRREGKEAVVMLKLDPAHGTYAPSWPAQCKKSEAVLAELLAFLESEQREDGSWGGLPQDLFAPLALLAQGGDRYRASIEKAARFHGRVLDRQRGGSLVNWGLVSAGIFLAEYEAKTKAAWVPKALKEIRDELLRNQYMDQSQIKPSVRESHPDSWPKTKEQQMGGFGHNPGFEGYGPIAMITAQAALAFSLMERVGVKVPEARHRAAYDFVARGTGRNGYVWYGDDVADHEGYADLGRTGAAGIAFWLSSFGDQKHREQALLHAACIGAHPEPFPDTHGSPPMGMGFAALAAYAADKASFRRLMDANRYWFVLSRCPDRSFYYQPNRDNAGYGADSRVVASAVTALIFSIPKESLILTGREKSR